MKASLHKLKGLASVIYKKRFEHFQIVLFVLLLLFSFWLMFHTFSYDGAKHQMRIAFKLWSDFGAHIPMIRSFSMGDNLNRFIHGHVEYPIFPGEPIRYHFLFYMIVGVLERLGVRIDWALNIPSALGFFLLLFFIYILALRLFRKQSVAILTLLFFLFNGTLGFIRFFAEHHLSMQTLQDIWSAKEFPAFAPWGPGEVTAFWNLNIYTNQRHLALAFAIVLLFILTCMKLDHLSFRKQLPTSILWGLVIGIFPYFHQPTLLIFAIIMATYFLLFPRLRLFLFVTGTLGLILTLPQILTMPEGASKAFEWYPGYIIHNDVTPIKFITHWIYNFGLHTLLVPIGFLLIPHKTKRFFLPLIPIFIIPNLFKFSVEVGANHKFFNFMMIMGAMLSAYAIVRFFELSKQTKRLVVIILTACFLILVTVFLTLSGIIDFRVIVNDKRGILNDIAADETANWIKNNTSPGAVFLNSQYLYHPASLAGRPIFLGWPYFPWSAGYKENRMPILRTLYDDTNHETTCKLLMQYNISYITVQNVSHDENLPTIRLDRYVTRYQPVFLSSRKDYAIFSTQTFCQ
jgi:hypothetical protein